MDLAEAVRIECDRQHVGEDRHQPLINAWQFARQQAMMGAPLTLSTLLGIAARAEPDNKGLLRTTPVTFANGGDAASAGVVMPLVMTLMDFWPTAVGDELVARDWLRQFLWIHPFIDGNGRAGWVLQQWLFNTWDDPQELIDFHW